MDVSRYLKLGFSSPQLAGRKLSQAYNLARSPQEYNPDGIDIFQHDWDNLVILDACRYDLFDSVCDFKGELRSVTSRGSATPEFLHGNFQGKTLHDTVYVTTNPMLHRHAEQIDVSFHHVIDLWNGDTWDDEHGTVLPEVVTQETLNAHQQYPNKRLLVHYMQPHYPFLGSDMDFDQGHVGPDEPEGLTTWMQVMTGEVDVGRNELWEAYEENLRIALPHVRKLCEDLPGKTVVTSDHGNMFGERSFPVPIREWGHPPSIWTEELVEVPWLEISSPARKTIRVDPPVESSPESTQTRERLRSLGYL